MKVNKNLSRTARINILKSIILATINGGLLHAAGTKSDSNYLDKNVLTIASMCVCVYFLCVHLYAISRILETQRHINNYKTKQLQNQR